MNTEKKWTPTHLSYLLMIRQLDWDAKGVRSVDIAVALGLSKPSVHHMLEMFAREGLIERKSYGVAFLTEAGEALAQKYAQYYDAVEQFLQEGFPQLEQPRAAVCTLLAEIPEHALQALQDRSRENPPLHGDTGCLRVSVGRTGEKENQ